MNSLGLAGALYPLVYPDSPAHQGGRPRGLFADCGLAALIFLVGCALLFLPLSANASSLFGAPQLKIIYSAETKGEIHPCLF